MAAISTKDFILHAMTALSSSFLVLLRELTKYQPIVAKMRDLGYTCKMVVLIFGSLGHVHKLWVSVLRLAGLSKRQSKQLAKFCSVSAVIGSLAVWRRRCFLYP